MTERERIAARVASWPTLPYTVDRRPVGLCAVCREVEVPAGTTCLGCAVAERRNG